MEALKNNTVGYAIAALGAVVALAGGLADTLGIGKEGADGLGGKQLAALLVGLVILAAGLAVVFLAGQEEDSGESGAADAADTGDAGAEPTAVEDDSEAGSEAGDAEAEPTEVKADAEAKSADAD